MHSYILSSDLIVFPVCDLVLMWLKIERDNLCKIDFVLFTATKVVSETIRLL